MAQIGESPARVRPRYGTRTLLAVIAIVALAFGWFTDRGRLRQAHETKLAALQAEHEYVLSITGTPGVQLSVTIVTWPASKQVETVTVPLKRSFKAQRAIAWIATLPEGKSGNNGNTYEVTLNKDGVVQTTCRGLIQKDERQNMYMNGDVTWLLTDS
jgi:hypothetical protein